MIGIFSENFHFLLRKQSGIVYNSFIYIGCVKQPVVKLENCKIRFALCRLTIYWCAFFVLEKEIAS